MVMILFIAVLVILIVFTLYYIVQLQRLKAIDKLWLDTWMDYARMDIAEHRLISLLKPCRQNWFGWKIPKYEDIQKIVYDSKKQA
jgi:hypothetical protein